jgi:S-adenosylmethionine uptake transporter
MISLYSRVHLFRGAAWLIAALAMSVFNDVIMKYVGSRLSSIEVTCLRFVFSILWLVPFMIWKGRESWRTERLDVHFLRGFMLFAGVALWVYGLKVVPISTATVINFTIPLFTLVLARMFLHEHIGFSRSISTLIGFLGALIVFNPLNVVIQFSPLSILFNAEQLDFQASSMLILLASILFAGLDVINKKFVMKETMLSMLFYGSLATTLISTIPTILVWQMPTMREFFWLFLLGAGANGILFFLLKAFRCADASALAPFRYIELVFSAGAGYALFSEIPMMSTWIGAAVIIPAALYVLLTEVGPNQNS